MNKGDKGSDVRAQLKQRGRPKMSTSDRAEVKAKISRIASDLFRLQGYHAVSMRRIAREIGVTPMALYTYFPSKRAILLSLWSEIFDDVAGAMAASRSETDAPAAQLEAMSLAYVSYWLCQRDRYFLVFMSRGLDRSDVRDFVSEGAAVAKHQPFFDLIAVATGAAPDDPDVKARGDRLICGLIGVVHATITIPGYDWAPVDDMVPAFVASACRR